MTKRPANPRPTSTWSARISHVVHHDCAIPLATSLAAALFGEHGSDATVATIMIVRALVPRSKRG